MKIIENKAKKSRVKVNDIPVGVCFEWNGRVCIMTDEKFFVALEDGRVWRDDGREVVPVNVAAVYQED